MTSGFADLPPLRDIIAQFGLSADKRLGQHFLLDRNLTDKIARAAGDLSQGTVIEVGPGPGGLTRSLLSAGASRVLAIERDARCIDALSSVVEASNSRLIVVAADALEAEFTQLAPQEPRRIVSNLPYNVGTPLLINWLQNIAAYHRFVLMFQKEVADRIVAPTGTSQYGRLSVMTQWLCHAERIFTVDMRAFTPPPKVKSAVVRLTPRNEPIIVSWQAMETVTKAAFGQRRKMLRQSLKSVVTSDTLEALSIAPERRAETLSVAEFVDIATAWQTNRGHQF